MKYCSFDTETTGLSPYSGAEIFAYCIGHSDGAVDVYRKENTREFFQILQDFFDDTNIAKICHNLKFELQFLHKHRINIPDKTEFHDTMIMSQMLNNLAYSHALDYLCYTYGQYPRELDKKVKQQFTIVKTYDKIDPVLMTKYQKADGERTMLLFEMLYSDICKSKKLLEDYKVEIELIKSTQRMESKGIKIDPVQCDKLITYMEQALDSLQQDVFDKYGEFINLNSDKQLTRVLFNIHKFPILAFTDKGKPSTDKDVLLQLIDRFPEEKILQMIMQCRSYTKGISMISSYKKLAVDGIIHPTINTNQARTGRESSSNPNMQNVSKEAGLKVLYPVPARRCFTAHTGDVLFFADYSGIELRLIIEVSGDPEMLHVLQTSGDPHTIATDYFYGDRFRKANDAEKKILRSAGKNAHFAMAYGANLSKMASTLNIPIVDLQEGYDRYASRFPKIAYFTKDTISQVKKCGYVTTPFGRRLHVQTDKPYIGANYLIQGTAAGILKRAQVAVDKYCKDELNDAVRIIIPIHDEIVFSFSWKLMKHKKEILKKISALMIDIPHIKVPLEVEWKMSTTSWDKAKGVAV